MIFTLLFLIITFIFMTMTFLSTIKNAEIGDKIVLMITQVILWLLYTIFTCIFVDSVGYCFNYNLGYIITVPLYHGIVSYVMYSFSRYSLSFIKQNQEYDQKVKVLATNIIYITLSVYCVLFTLSIIEFYKSL